MPWIHRLLWALWALALGASFLIDAGWFDSIRSQKTVLHLTSSVLLVLAAVATAALVSTAHKWTAGLVAAGMALGCLGDFSMAGLLTFMPNRVMGGMLFFGLGHICYIQATGQYRKQMKLQVNLAWWLAVLAWQVIGVIIWYMVVTSSDKHMTIRYPALIYGALLAATAGVTSGLALRSSTFQWVAHGAILFLVSDAVLAWQLFHDSTPFTSFLVWATYGPGQMLIVYGFASVLLTKRTASSTV